MPVDSPLGSRTRLWVVAAMGLLAPSVALGGAARASTDFTIQDVLSAPFLAGLRSAPSAPRVAWISNLRGVRNIWMAEGPSYEPRPITSFSEDDGEALSEPAFAADGRSVVFVRGGAPNARGELPNPQSLPGAPEAAIYLAALEGGPARRLAEGRSLAPHPLEPWVAFRGKDAVQKIAFEPDAKPERLFSARGETGTLVFSPDGKRLAFVSRRGDHSFIGVLELANKAIHWMDPSVDSDDEPAFSPDGLRLAFRRLPATKEYFAFGPRRSGEPWSIRVVEVATGQGREIFRAQPGPGSVFHDAVSTRQLLWAAGDRIVFPWEKTGWLHLYSVPAGGGAPTALTRGAFEVEDVSLSPDRATVVFNSNEGDPERRHAWSVPAAGGRSSPLTAGPGIEWSPVLTADGTLVFLRSSATRPGQVVIKKGDAAPRELQSLPAGFPQAMLVEPEPVTLTAGDGMVIHGQLFKPRDLASGGRRPALVFLHGGSRRQMLLGFHYMEYYHNAYAMNEYLARRGYLVLALNYRSGIGYGMEFREALNYGATGASEFADVLGAGLYLRSRPDVDPARIGLWGGSYGGYLTALGLARASDLFAAGVDFHGVHDWNVVIKNFAPAYDPEKDHEYARRAFESSPLASVKTWRSPVLLIHGDDDRNVPFSETVSLMEALRKQGVSVEQRVFPDEIHDFLLHRTWVEGYTAAAEFLGRQLKPPR